jgi:predicted metalloprotease with PDZ domain
VLSPDRYFAPKKTDMEKIVVALFLSFLLSKAYGQSVYRYSVDLTKADNDRLEVTLLTPKVGVQKINYRFARIIPGTYRISDFGRFVSSFKAYDQQGHELPVQRADSNTWNISRANQLYRITYNIDDTWDSEIADDVFTMAGTNIEAGKNFVVNTAGFFGYLDGFRNTEFDVNFKKPHGFFGSSPLQPAKSWGSFDEFRFQNLDEMYDNPIMYCVPDTAVLHVGGADIMVSVYSPKKQIKAGIIAKNLQALLKASAYYLGGSLPVKKYAFLYYFNSEQKPSVAQGALEHNYSSFYTLPELPLQQSLKTVLDVSGHEFFHVITPLAMSSREVKQFNFEQPVLSRHLWLYEGSTEYAAHHVQVKYALIDVPDFLDRLSGKINVAEHFSDTLPFTVLSKESAGRFKDQYVNVYYKGALISACLDLYLLHLSQGTYNLQQLKHDLSVKYGRDAFFKDEELFDVITKMTYPEVGEFFKNYVQGNKKFPYEQFFSYGGVQIVPERKTEEISLGGFNVAPDAEGKIRIIDLSHLNAFGKKMGYQMGDQLVSMQGTRLTPENLGPVIAQVKADIKAGDVLTASVVRPVGGKDSSFKLSAPFEKTITLKKNVLELVPQASEVQALIRNAWLSTPDRPLPAVAKIEDVKDISSIVASIYDVLSGKAGTKNWERLRSLYYPGAVMSAVQNLPNAQTFYKQFSFEDYIEHNGPLFSTMDFYEQEIGRKTTEFGNIAVVQSAYQFRFSESGKIEQRGVNIISLVKDKGRWWVTSIMWQDESPTNLLPKDLVQK